MDIYGGTNADVTFASSDIFQLQVLVKEATDYGSRLYLKSLKRGAPILLARLGGANGPIMAKQEIDEFTTDQPAKNEITPLYIPVGDTKGHILTVTAHSDNENNPIHIALDPTSHKHVITPQQGAKFAFTARDHYDCKNDALKPNWNPTVTLERDCPVGQYDVYICKNDALGAKNSGKF